MPERRGGNRSWGWRNEDKASNGVEQESDKKPEWKQVSGSLLVKEGGESQFRFSGGFFNRRWHYEKRNISIGDVVLISDKILRRGQWKLGLVINVLTGVDNIVRRVTIRYINPATGSPIEIERPVQRLIVLLPIENKNQA